MSLQNCEESLAFQDSFAIPRTGCAYTVALAGNPNTGKSTLFNALTGLKQHTGNWPGKTVVQYRGNYKHQNREFTLVDLPGTYSLLANSAEEQIARDFICFGRPDATVIVVDATCLERNLNLALQVMEITGRAVVCLNLIDEARRKNIVIDHLALESRLGVPVIPSAARSGEGLGQLKEVISLVADGAIRPEPVQLSYPAEIEQLLEDLGRRLPPGLPSWVNRRWIALRLLDGDRTVADWLSKNSENNPTGRRIS
jgi:Fe2+ transport system protein B